MDSTILIKGAGVLKAEIILSALQEYKHLCNQLGNSSREKVVCDIIREIQFDHFL